MANQRITSACHPPHEIVELDREKVDYIDVSPKMMVSIATAMIPLPGERRRQPGLMGANMPAAGRAPAHHPEPHVAHRHHFVSHRLEIAVCEGEGEVAGFRHQHHRAV